MELDRNTQKLIKKALGKKAASLVQEGMLVGLGTGSTATCFIESLIERCRHGLNIQAVSSSEQSMQLAKQGGIPILDMEKITSIDLTIDGADEVDPQRRMIKGGGGAHVREKILAYASKEWVVIIDESKLVPHLGAFGVPIEILPFGWRATVAKLEALGYSGSLRKKDSSIYITDNGGYIFDIHFPTHFSHPEKDHERMLHVPGVVDTGFFIGLASKVLVGYADGKINLLNEVRA